MDTLLAGKPMTTQVATTVTCLTFVQLKRQQNAKMHQKGNTDVGAFLQVTKLKLLILPR